MQMKRLTKEKRLEIREARKELQLIIKRSRDICFNYIVVKQPQPKVCFLSGCVRDVLPLKMNTKVPGPNYYHIPRTLIKKFAPKHGYTPLATNTPRFINKKPVDGEKSLSVSSLPVSAPQPIKQCFKPFGIGETTNYEQKFLTPYPGIYETEKFGYEINSGFGRMRKILPSVRIVCTMLNIAECSLCGNRPEGDYRHDFRKNVSLCSSCWHKEVKKTKLCNNNLMKSIQMKAYLALFKRARHCEFYHYHNGTTAAVQHLSKKDFKFKIQKENYLASYNI